MLNLVLNSGQRCHLWSEFLTSSLPTAWQLAVLTQALWDILILLPKQCFLEKHDTLLLLLFSTPSLC